jgi:site-specific DNA-methyltransferase (adenine-specific)
MLKNNNIEIIYDAVDGYATLLYETASTPYLQGVAQACSAILAGSAGPEVPEASRRKAAAVLKPALNREFQKEEARRALQLCFLKGFKHVRRPNTDITPDGVGILVGYLIGKLVPGNDGLVLFDPLVGTANLLVAAANHLERPTTLYGVENDMVSYKLAEALFLMTDAGDEVFLQDTFSFSGLSADVVLTDFPPSTVADDGAYFPYEVIRQHRRNLKPDGWFVGVIANDFFSLPGAEGFRKTIAGDWNVVGLVKLPDAMFKGTGRSILILQNAAGGAKPPARSLVAEIPSFEDGEAAERAVAAIGAWFDNLSR